jgi:hypothetical protein
VLFISLFIVPFPQWTPSECSNIDLQRVKNPTSRYAINRRLLVDDRS